MTVLFVIGLGSATESKKSHRRGKQNRANHPHAEGKNGQRRPTGQQGVTAPARPGRLRQGHLRELRNVHRRLWSWNDLFLPLVFLVSDDLRTLPVGMLFFQGRFTIDYGLMSAGVLIISLPVTVLFLMFQRDFVKGLASGAL